MRRRFTYQHCVDHPGVRLGNVHDLTLSCDGLIITHSYFPGHIHAFYLEYVYYDRREQAREGRFSASRAPGIYSERVQNGGTGYGTIVQPVR
jgi:hypothetical protein